LIPNGKASAYQRRYHNYCENIELTAKADIDDIDHLSNRRVRTVGEQLSHNSVLV
jgi:DNA-directed RNA polymerase beta subunit